MDEAYGKIIFEKLMNIMKNFDLHIDVVRGQGYNKGYDMKRKIKVYKTDYSISILKAYSCGCYTPNLLLFHMTSLLS